MLTSDNENERQGEIKKIRLAAFPHPLSLILNTFIIIHHLSGKDKYSKLRDKLSFFINIK